MLKNMKIRSRMVFFYALIIVISMVAGLAALFMLRSTGANLTSFYNNNYTVTVNTWTARRSQQAARADLLQAIISKDDAVKLEKVESAKQNLATMRETFPIIRSTFKGDSGLVDQIEEILNQAIVYRDQIFQLITDGKDDEAFEIMNNEYIPSWIRWVIYSSEIAGSNAKRMVEEGERAVIFSTVIVRIILGASILFAILLGIYLSNSVRKPVTELEKAAKMISDGDMNAVITYHSRDELGSLSESMRTTVHRLSSIISDLSYLLQEIAGGYFHLHTKVEQDYVGDFQPLLLTLRQNRD